MPSIVLPNQMRVAAVSSLEARVLYHEIFQQRTYMRHGIRIANGDCIFDVGANIGLYTLFATREASHLTVFAFEPIPAIFALLQENVRRHAAGATVRLFRGGLSGSDGEVTFEYDRFSSLTSSMRARDAERSVRKDAALRDWVRATILDLRRIAALPNGVARLLLWATTVPALRAGIDLAWLALLGATMARKRLVLRRITRPVRTVSHVMRRFGVEAVALMKIDVEGGELEVIRGIEDEDWPKIRQLVVEVHDVDGRLDLLRSELERRGYQTSLEREDWAIHELLEIWTLFAVRR